MPTEYTQLVEAMKSLTQGTPPGTVITLPMAENEWNTRPDTESYGIISLDFEQDQMPTARALTPSRRGAWTCSAGEKAAADGWKKSGIPWKTTAEPAGVSIRTRTNGKRASSTGNGRLR